MSSLAAVTGGAAPTALSFAYSDVSVSTAAAAAAAAAAAGTPWSERDACFDAPPSADFPWRPSRIDDTLYQAQLPTLLVAGAEDGAGGAARRRAALRSKPAAAATSA